MEVFYNGRLVNCDNFRVVLHHESGISRVAEGWDDYQNLLNTGKWFESLSDVPRENKSKKIRVNKKAANDANSA